MYIVILWYIYKNSLGKNIVFNTVKLISSEEKEFYKLGISYYVSAANDKSYVGLRGLKENLPEGLKLLEHLWMNYRNFSILQ